MKGCSRKYRDATPFENGVFPVSRMLVPNPLVPLRFELASGSDVNLLTDGGKESHRGHYDYIVNEANSIPQFTDYYWYAAKEMMDAHMLALTAYGHPDLEEGARIARAALEISPICPEAYNVLAVTTAKSYEEALEFYKKAEELGSQEAFQRALQDQMWLVTPLRPYFRAVYGVANTLRKMGRYSKAAEVMDKVYGLDPEWHGYSSYVNVYALWPAIKLEVLGAQATLDWMDQWPHTSAQLAYHSSGLYWMATYALAWMITHPKERFRVPQLSEEEGAMLQNCKSGGALYVLNFLYPTVVDMLLGDMEVPGGVLTTTAAPNGIGVAASYVITCGVQWRSRPQLLERLRTFRNTFEVRNLVVDLRSDFPIDMDVLRGYLKEPAAAGGVYPDMTLANTSGMEEGMCDIIGGGRRKGRDADPEFTEDEKEALQLLLSAGFPPVLKSLRHHPPSWHLLHMSCYHGHGPEVVRMVVEGGADPLLPDPYGQHALAMTVNQGNWRELQVLLQLRPGLLQITAREAGLNHNAELPAGSGGWRAVEHLLGDMFSSSCVPCVAGGRACQRCEYGSPHSKHCSFTTTIDVLVQVGKVRSSSVIIKYLDKNITDWVHPAFRQLKEHFLKAAAAAAEADKAGRKLGTVTEMVSAAAVAAARMRSLVMGPNRSGVAGGGGGGGRGTSGSSSGGGGHHHHHHHGDGCGCSSGGSGGGHDHSHHGSGHESSHQHVGSSRPSSSSSGSVTASGRSGAIARVSAAADGGSVGGRKAAGSSKSRSGSSSSKACRSCGEVPEKLMSCSSCKKVRYCSRECQKADWKRHKEDFQITN